MARNLTCAMAVISSLANKLSPVAMSRRGFAAAASGGVSGGGGGGGGGSGFGRTAGMMRKIDQKARESAWAPDPVTGYYRPADRAVETDAAELRAMLLNHTGKN